jgi:hypothetical protein
VLAAMLAAIEPSIPCETYITALGKELSRMSLAVWTLMHAKIWVNRAILAFMHRFEHHHRPSISDNGGKERTPRHGSTR